jgi:hypothetical protein
MFGELIGELKSAANRHGGEPGILLQALSSPVRHHHFGEPGEPAHCFSSPVRHTRRVANGERARELPVGQDHESVLEGGAGTQTFAPKELCRATGGSRATAHRQIDRLCRAGLLIRNRPCPKI